MGIMSVPKGSMVRCPSCNARITVYYQMQSENTGVISKVKAGWYDVTG